MTKPETPEQWANWTATEIMRWEADKNGRGWMIGDGLVYAYGNWNPYADLNHCHELEMKLKEMGLHIQYSEILIPISNNGKLPKRIEDDFMEALRLGRECQFRTTTATASQRLEAMWQCVTHNKESNE